MRWILLPALWIVTSLPPAAAQEQSVDQEGPTSLEPILIAAHERTIRGIAFSPDGSSIWTASEDGTAKEWSLAKRSLIRQLGERVRLLAAVAVSRDGKTVAICGRGGIQIWEPMTGAQKATIAADYALELDLSPDGSRLAVAYMLTDYAAVFDTSTGKEIAKLTEPAYPGETDEPSNFRAMGAVAFSPDGKYLAVCNAPPNFMSIISLYDAQSLDLRGRFVAHTADRTYCLAFSADGKLIACGTQDGQVKVFDVPVALAGWAARAKATAAEAEKAAETVAKLAVRLGADDFNERVAATKALEAIGPAALEPLEKLEAETDDAEVQLRARQAIAKIKEDVVGPLRGIAPRHALNVPRIGSVRSIAFSPDGRILAIGSMKLGTPDGQLELWRLDRPNQPWRIAADQPVNWLAFSPDGKWVASGLTGGQMLLTAVE